MRGGGWSAELRSLYPPGFIPSVMDVPWQSLVTRPHKESALCHPDMPDLHPPTQHFQDFHHTKSSFQRARNRSGEFHVLLSLNQTGTYCNCSIYTQKKSDKQLCLASPTHVTNKNRIRKTPFSGPSKGYSSADTPTNTVSIKEDLTCRLLFIRL